MWVCEASEVNIWTVFAVGPNGANNNKNKKNKNNFASSRSDHRGPTITFGHSKVVFNFLLNYPSFGI